MTGAAPICTIAVLGDGIVAHAAAIIFRRALPKASVTLIETPIDPSAMADRIDVAGARLHDFHRKIGLASELFAREAKARPRLGTRYARGDRQWLVLEGGEEAPRVEGIALHQLWLRQERAEGAAIAPWHQLTPLAGLIGRIAADAPLDERLGAHFDPAAYRALLARLARHLDVTMLRSKSWSTDLDTHGVAALRIDDGTRVSADLYADCTGALIERVGGGFESWSRFLPGTMLRSKLTGDALDTLAIAGDQDAREAGHRPEGWTGNVVAFGDAAVATSPSAQLLPVMFDDILRAIRFLPHTYGAPHARAEYNRQTRIAHAHLLDWSAAPHLDPDAPEQHPLPTGLAHLVEQFRARGRVPFRDGDPIGAGDWIAMLIGLGLRPERIDPTALVPDDMRCSRILQHMLARHGAERGSAAA